MKSNSDQRTLGKQQAANESFGDNVAKSITSGLARFLSKLCVWFSVTPESIKKQKPGARGNAPPPSGGLSS